MKSKKEYAITDNMYSVYMYEENHYQYKHIFMPNAISGRNSASHIINGNGFNGPQRARSLFDLTRWLLYESWEKI